MSWLSSAHSCIGCFKLHQAGASHRDLFAAWTAAWFPKERADKPGRFNLAVQQEPCVNIWVLFGQASVRSSLFCPKLWPGTKYARRGKTHKAYPSASFLWINDCIINIIIHLSSISEHDSGPISASPPPGPNEGPQAGGHEAFGGFSF